MQRLRVKFRRGEEVKYITHLDLMRLWHRAMRRAGIPLMYSQGYSPHPRLSLAAPLAIGTTSDGELMDVSLERRISPHHFMRTLSVQLPKGIDIVEVVEISPVLPSLQSQVRSAECVVTLKTDRSRDEVEDAIEGLLAKEELPWQHSRDTGIRKYDLRALIDDLWLIDMQPQCRLGMLLRCDNKGTGRPEQVALALGFDDPPASIHRTRLILARPDKAGYHR
jgi:radical SAM-linked protein